MNSVVSSVSLDTNDYVSLWYNEQRITDWSRAAESESLARCAMST